jgi:peptidoglycan/xylan/chitin deacetylase (PgdA/CDA1 family)
MARRKKLFIVNIKFVRRFIFFFLVIGLIATGLYLAIRQSENNILSPTPVISSEEIDRGDVSRRQVIFTFDGGSGTQSAEAILKVLAEHRVKGTFFVTGKFIETNSDLVKKIAEAGHEMFNHTYNHPHLTNITDSEIVGELEQMDMLLRSTVGISSKPFFRPPFGDRDQHVRTVAAKVGYRSVYWTVDAHDWMESEGITVDEVKSRIMSSLAPGNIYLMHIGDNITGLILDDIFDHIESKGYEIVSLTQGL